MWAVCSVWFLVHHGQLCRYRYSPNETKEACEIARKTWVDENRENLIDPEDWKCMPVDHNRSAADSVS